MDEAAARRAHWILTGLRLIGVALVAFGMAMYAGRFGEPHEMGLYFIVLGAFEFFLFPALFKARWRDRDGGG